MAEIPEQKGNISHSNETLFSLFNVYMEALSPILNLSHSKQETFGPTSSEDAMFEVTYLFLLHYVGL